jgi:predicted acetyltransferase
MPEIRTPRPEEMDDVLGVMCEAFQLPFATARKLFYKDPYFDASNKRVLIEDGIVASCLSIIPARMWFGEALVDVAGIANVATLQAHRGRGCASCLLTDTISLLKDRGFGVAALLPYSYDFYRPFGWEIGGVQYRVRTHVSLIRPFIEIRFVRPAVPSDQAEVADLYAFNSLHQTGRCERNEKRWSHLFDHVRFKAVFKRSELEGYAFYELENATGGPKKLSILELVARNLSAQRGLLSFLASRHTDIQEIELTGSWTDVEKSGLSMHACASGQVGTTMETLPGPMFRIIDLQKLMIALKPNFTGFSGSAIFAIDDQILTPLSLQAVAIEGNGETIEIRVANAGEGLRQRISGSVGAWSTVMCGHFSLSDAVSQNLLHPSTKSCAEAAAPLFPRRHPFIPPLDHF